MKHKYSIKYNHKYYQKSPYKYILFLISTSYCNCWSNSTSKWIIQKNYFRMSICIISHFKTSTEDIVREIVMIGKIASNRTIIISTLGKENIIRSNVFLCKTYTKESSKFFRSSFYWRSNNELSNNSCRYEWNFWSLDL